MVALRKQPEISQQPAQLTPAHVFASPEADARALLTRLADWAQVHAPQHQERWSHRRTAVFIALASGVLWAGLLVFGLSLLRNL